MRWFLRMGAAVATLCWGGGVCGQTPPVPLDVGTWVTASDYPATALRNSESGVVGFEVDVNASGRPVACRIVKSSESAALDAATCRAVTARGSFEPARDATGKTTIGTIRLKFAWRLPEIVRQKLGSFAQVERISFDADGNISGCSGENTEQPSGQLPGCRKFGQIFLVEHDWQDQHRSGILTVFAVQNVEGEPLPANAPASNIPPYWTLERTFTVRPDGNVVDCTQRQSDRGTGPCDDLPSYLPLTDGKPRQVTMQVRWSFQPAK